VGIHGGADTEKQLTANGQVVKERNFETSGRGRQMRQGTTLI